MHYVHIYILETTRSLRERFVSLPRDPSVHSMIASIAFPCFPVRDAMLQVSKLFACSLV